MYFVDTKTEIFIQKICVPGACLDIFQKGFTNFFVLNLPLKYAYIRYALAETSQNTPLLCT